MSPRRYLKILENLCRNNNFLLRKGDKKHKNHETLLQSLFFLSHKIESLFGWPKLTKKTKNTFTSHKNQAEISKNSKVRVQLICRFVYVLRLIHSFNFNLKRKLIFSFTFYIKWKNRILFFRRISQNVYMKIVSK